MMNAQQTVTIGTGTGTTYYTPFNSLWGYSFVEAIYTATEINSAGGFPGVISSISFEKSSGSSQNNNIVLYMKNVSRSSFSSNTDWETVTASDIVYTGTFDISSSGWATITLDNPFVWDGSSNLMVAMHEYTSGYSTQYFYYTSATNSVISFHSDSSDPDPYNLSSYSGTIYTQSNRANMRIAFSAGAGSCISLSPNVSNIGSYSADLNWINFQQSASSWDIVYGETGIADTLTGTVISNITDTFYTLTGLSSSTNYTVWLKSNCSGDVGPWSAPRTFTTDVSCPAPTNVAIQLGADGQSGTLTWTAGLNETSWDIYIPTAGEVPNTSSSPTTSVTTNSYSVTGLSNSTDYIYYVRANCGVGDYSFWIPVSFRTPQVPATLPYTQNWENGTENVQWTILNGSATNKWYIGSAVNNGGDTSLYISDDNGATNHYDISSSSDVWAYRDIYFDPIYGEYELAFDYRVDGESCCDYLKVFLGPCVEPSGSSTPAGATQLGGNLNEQASWTHTSFSLAGSVAGAKRLYFLWHNDGSVGTAPPAAIDNISVAGFNCGHPTALTLDSTTQTAAYVHFTPASSNDSQWEIILLAPGDTIDPSLAIPLTTTTYDFQNLASGIQYSVYVRTDCSGEYSGWEGPLHFTLGVYNMGTTGWDTLYTCGSVIYDNGGPTGDYSNDISAYLVVYPDQPGSFVQVHGTLVAESSSYDYLIFYDGVGTANQILKTNQSSSATFTIPTITSTTGPLTIYFHSDVSTVYAGYEIFTTCVNCVSPSLTVTNLSYDEATLDWSSFTGSQTDFEIVYGPAGINPSTATPEVVSNVTSYTLTGLTDNTSYDAYIRTDCGDGTYATWEHITFTTNPLCTSPRNVTVSQVAGSSALVSWLPALLGASDYTVEYSEAGQNNWIPQIVTGTSLFLSGLTPLTAYEVRVYSNCAAGSADTIQKNFVTHCLAGGELSIGNGTATSTYFPSYSFYKNGYSQQIFLSSEMNGASTITSVSFEMTAVAQQRNYKIYLMHTNLSTSATWIPADSAQLCFQGSHTFTVGWNTFDFTTPFQYNGTDNLVLIVIDENASYSSGNTFRVHTVPSNTCHMWYSDSYTYSINSSPNGSSYSTTTDRNNVKFGGSCDSTVTCIAPNIALGLVDQTTAEIMWVPGYAENSWNLEYKAVSDANWTTVTGLSGSTYTITGLSANTEYSVRMQSDCGGGDISDWRSVNFRTACGLTMTLPFVENFDNYGTGTASAYPPCWSKFSTYTASTALPYCSATSYQGAGSLYLYVGTSGTFNMAITPAFDNTIPVNTLQAVFMYRASNATDRTIVGVMTDPADAATFVPVDTVYPSSTASDWVEKTVYFTNYTGNGQYIAFKNEYTSTNCYTYIDNLEIGLIPSCPKPNNLTVTGTTSSSVTLTWTESGTATGWNIAYGPVGFDPDTATTVEPVTAYPATITNLASGTPYEFYVQADCGGGDESYWRGPVTATPGSYNMHTSGWDTLYTCGAAIYDDGGPSGNYSGNCNSYLVIYPEQPGSFVQISGTIYAEYNTYDNLYIYDGVGTTNALFSTYGQSSGTLTIPTITSSTGPLTIYFVSDGSVYYAGYEIFTTCVNCVSPALAVNNISNTGATLDWSSFTGSQTNFEIVYGAPTINPDNETPIVVSNVSTYALTGLTALTGYVAYIRTDCGDGTYSNWNSVSFSTLGCDPSNACVYTFVLGDGYGDGWNDGYLTVEQGSAIVATLEAIDHNLSSTQTYDTVTVSLCDNISTSLVWHIGDYDDEVSITVIKPDGTQLYTHTDMDSYTTYTFTTDCSGSGPVVTDPTVATNAASNIAQTNATLNATITNPDNVTITAKGFEWKATTGGTYTQIAGTGTGNTFTANLTGLTPNTGYTFKAFITYNGTTVYGSEMTFTTLNQQQETCAAPTNVTASNITNTTADISWTQQGDVTSWDVNYKVAGATAWNSATTTTNPYTLTGLSESTTYEVQVIAHCTNGVTSDPSATITLTTVGINDYELNSVTVFPNPTTGMIQIQNSESRIQDVEVYDAYGKLLNVVSVNDNATALDLSGYAAGTYFVKIMTENGVVTKRVVKQ